MCEHPERQNHCVEGGGDHGYEEKCGESSKTLGLYEEPSGVLKHGMRESPNDDPHNERDEDSYRERNQSKDERYDGECGVVKITGSLQRL